MTARWATFEPDPPRPRAGRPADLRIRVASPGDCPAIAAIEAEREGRDQAAAEAGCRAGLADPERLLLVAETAGAIAGFGRVARYVPPVDGDWNAPAGWYLAGLIVRDGWLRRGIGAELTRRRLEWIRERADVAYYFANARNLVSLRLHRRLGFEEVTRDVRIPWADFDGGVGVLCRVDLAGPGLAPGPDLEPARGSMDGRHPGPGRDPGSDPADASYTRLVTKPTPTQARPPLADRALAARVRAVPPSGIRRFFDIAATMEDVISLGVGEPDFATPSQVIEAGIASLRAERTHYTSNYGTIELRRAIADHLERRYGVRYDPAREILVTVGASEAVDLALRATVDPGDEVILHEPSYVAYVPAIVFAGGTVRHVATRFEDDFALDPRAVAAAVTPRTKALFLGYPCNPTGAVLPPDVQDELAAIAVDHDLLVYSDEIYDRLAYGGYRHRAMSALPGMRERTVLMGGFSKAYAMTGWRVGYVCAPAPILEGIVKVHQYGIMSAPTTAQDAALAAVTGAEADVEAMRAEYDRRRRLLVDGLNALGLDTFEPRGAFYAFPRITSTGLDDEAFVERLLAEEHVAAVPGSAFGPSGAGHVRMCYATAYEKLEEALERIGRFVERARRGA